MKAMISRADLIGRCFATDDLQTLFNAILVDDDVDPVTPLPGRIVLDRDPGVLLDGYRISRQLWTETVDRHDVISLIDRVQRDGDLDMSDRLAFKHVRAKLKHLRFACALFDARHRYPTMMDWVTTAMGHLQDAFKNGERNRARREARLCRLLFSAAPQALLRREHDRFIPTDSKTYLAYMRSELMVLEQALARPTMTGARFHATRKVASRQAAFYCSLLAVAPGEETFLMSRAVAAINGLMGSMHDELIERRVAGVQDYDHTPFPLPSQIREHLTRLTKQYRLSGL